jgi:hypothetical protein
VINQRIVRDYIALFLTPAAKESDTCGEGGGVDKCLAKALAIIDIMLSAIEKRFN